MRQVDLAFRVTGSSIPADHANPLYAAISHLIPVFHGDPSFAVHQIRGALDRARRLIISRTSELVIRTPASRIPDLLPLAGSRLTLAGDTIDVGIPTPRALTPSARLFARLVVIRGFMETAAFLESANRKLDEEKIAARANLVPNPKADPTAAAGAGSRSPWLRRTVEIHGRKIVGFAVRVEGLTAEESIRLQEKGLGGRRHFGCGIFTPERR